MTQGDTLRRAVKRNRARPGSVDDWYGCTRRPHSLWRTSEPLLFLSHRLMDGSESQLSHSLAGGMPSVPQPLYHGQQHRGPVPGDMGLGPKMPPAYLGGPEPPKLNHMGPGPQPGMAHQMSPPLNHPFLPPHFGSMNNLVNQPNKKRKFSESPTNTINATMLPPSMNGVLSIKQEPPAVAQYSQYVGDCGGDDDFPYNLDSNGEFLDGSYQVIKWQPFNPTTWNTLTDANFKDLPTPTYRVDADKGFNYSVPDEAFVCQKKNHFQVTVHVGLQGNPKYIRTPDGLKRIEDFFVHFHGIKMESPTQTVKIEQSQSDRSKKPFHPVKVDLIPDQVIKLTVGRLHYSETTSNNMRKKGKPNPDQRYFKLVVALQAHSGQNSYLICAHSSERIIVRASNPGQFDSEVDVMWQKGHTGESVYHVGRVGVNTDHPEESLTVHGNIRLTGHLMQPSDIRAKEKLEEIDPKNQLENVQKLRIYRYEYTEDYAEESGIPPDRRADTGVIAQEIMHVLPDAVQSTGDVHLPNGQTLDNFLVVNKDRLFMENVGAVKELCKLTDNLEVRIDELEKMNKRLSKLRRYDSIKSTVSSKSASSNSTVSSSTATPPRKSSPRNSSSHHSSHHRRRSSGGKGGVFAMPAMCGNRFIQITIIILILIMAFCLVAITTLYILERHKQMDEKASSSSAIQATPPPGQRTSLPTHAPIINPNRINNITALPNRTDTTTTMPPTTTTKRSDKTTTTVATTRIPTRIPKLPEYPPCKRDHCEELCCPMPPEDEPGPHIVINHGDGNNPAYHYNPGDGEEGIIYRQEPENEGPPIDTTASHSTNTVVMNQQVKRNDNMQVVVQGAGPGYNTIPNNGKLLAGHHYMYKRQASSGGETDDISLVVKEQNFTIGSQFCLDDCPLNNRTYLVPMSPFFQFQPITLQFRMSRDRQVTLCSVQRRAQCPSVDNVLNLAQPESKSGEVVEWTLYIGIHFKTRYNFRVVEGHGLPANNTNEICSLQPAPQLTIRDYTVRFQRSCLADVVE
ncbi:hypothetical protein BaRGS_00019974 [Batillaria attramentaria]|uniref:Myelin regulatory factor n=1 Tax=Batillaria attramentaria TaxID=370345 RepID=A0ABD0KP32_9CAEN